MKEGSTEKGRIHSLILLITILVFAMWFIMQAINA